jgi:diphthamide synthase (EF-2-diphthine--ammonia ligase)
MNGAAGVVAELWFDGGMKKKILLSWSGGKDSAWALHLLRQAGEFEVGGLLTTVNEKFRRVAIHGFREELLERQAVEAGLPLWKIDLPFPCTNAEYEARMAVACERAVREGFVGVAFGDLFLEEIRAYRVAKLAGTGLEPVFPVWGIPTGQLAEEMLVGGLRARLTCCDPRKVPAEFAGREWDRTLLGELPEGVDPCGENGEFHSFCWAGPMFAREIRVKVGERVMRDGFSYADLVGVSPSGG